MIVNLLPPDIKLCREAALCRVEERIRAGAYAPQSKEKKLKDHFAGTLGEFVVCKHYSCKWLGKYFEGKEWDNRTWDTEVGEVRATFRPGIDKGMRFYVSDDRPRAPYIWVCLRKFGSTCIQAKLVGWAYQSDRKNQWFDDDKGYWIVPKEFLRSMDTLPVQI